MKGKPRSEETARKISESMKGTNHPRYGKHHTEDARRKISEFRKDFHYSEESKRKMAEARKLYWQKRKLEKLNQQINDTIIS